MKKLSFIAFCVSLSPDSPSPLIGRNSAGRIEPAISQETGLLKEWPKDGPPLAWKVTGLGGGYSSPAVASGRISA